MRQNDRGGVASDRRLEDLGDPHGRRIDRAAIHRHDIEHMIFRIEDDHAEFFLPEATHLDHEHAGHVVGAEDAFTTVRAQRRGQGVDQQPGLVRILTT